MFASCLFTLTTLAKGEEPREVVEVALEPAFEWPIATGECNSVGMAGGEGKGFSVVVKTSLVCNVVNGEGGRGVCLVGWVSFRIEEKETVAVWEEDEGFE